jgi:bifunctional non-homologous end joining protein LigD
VRGTTIETYRQRRDFSATAEPAPGASTKPSGAKPIFVVQKHDARRLHWDFRLEHGGVLWSWAVPKGPSLDPADKRLAVRTEDHPLDYADFAGIIPEGQYGAGTVETWDRGTWEPTNGDADAALAKGELKFELHGARLNGRFVLVRLKPRPKDRGENWLLIKEHDVAEARGADAEKLEKSIAPPGRTSERAQSKRTRTDMKRQAPKVQAPLDAPVDGATRGALPAEQGPQLATLADEPPEDDANWLSEVKFDGYRLLAFKDGDAVRLVTRNGHDWTARLPTIAKAVSRLPVDVALADGELVTLREDGVSSFALLQRALSAGSDRSLFYYVFDLLHLNGWDLRRCPLVARKAALQRLSEWRDALRYSDHQVGRSAAMRREACALKLEGIVVKRADAPYRAGRNRNWLKLKCSGREELVVLGWTPPQGSRQGLGALHLGYRDESGVWQYAGAVGSGFTERELEALRTRLDPIAGQAPPGMMVSDEPIDRGVRWVDPELIAEVQFTGWSGSGRVRHAVYLGLREDKKPDEVVRPLADPDVPRTPFGPTRKGSRIVKTSTPAPRLKAAAKTKTDADEASAPRTVAVRKPAKGAAQIGDMTITHADRELWPGISKRDLAEYWLAVADRALPEIAGRPLALVRCPEGIDGEHFFQKHAKPGFPHELLGDAVDGAPYLVLQDVAGLLACAQVSAIELHAWGSRLPDALHPDRVVFDLDPGEGVAFTEIVEAAKEVRDRLQAEGLAAFCRTTGGKGLHVVAPLVPSADWDTTRAWCKGVAEAMAADSPERFVSRVPKVERRGRILVDWLRNGLGSTAVASYSPRARPGATVATRLDWREVTPKLDPAAFNLRTVPSRLARQGADPWAGFAAAAVPLPAKISGGGRRR